MSEPRLVPKSDRNLDGNYDFVALPAMNVMCWEGSCTFLHRARGARGRRSGEKRQRLLRLWDSSLLCTEEGFKVCEPFVPS